MTQKTNKSKRLIRGVWQFLVRNKWYVFGLAVVAFWCLPYFTLGNRIEWGDFSFLGQSYEAMKASIVHYDQFPWWNPWESGGTPLYADPQMGLFSIQMLLTFPLGAPIAMQLTVALFTFLGFGSMLLLLRKYFKVAVPLAVLLSLLWIFCTFFVAHLPSHFTFIWYLLAPFYVYLALTIRTWRGGLGLGLAFAVMALAAVHNAFFHISLVCSVILAVRLFMSWRKKQWGLSSALGVGGLTFLLIAGHRVFYAMQYVRGVEREVADPAPHVLASISGAIVPFSRVHHIDFPYPDGIHGFGELTGTLGLFASIAALVCLIYLIKRFRAQGKTSLTEWKTAFIVLGGIVATFALALGSFFKFAPYAFLKQIPVFGNMRVPTRWFIWMCLGLIIFIGVVATRAALKDKNKRLFTGVFALLVLGVVEMLLLNWNYQPNVLVHKPVIAPEPITSYEFVQMRDFGETRQLPGGKTIPDPYGNLPHRFGEYEATLFNIGIIDANNVLADVRGDPRVKRCSYAVGCGLVLTSNAKVTFWSPNKIVLERTADGPILLNLNNSNYFLVNGQRQTQAGIREPFKDFVITAPEKDITIEARPAAIF